MARMIVAETCPACGSLDVRVAEPHWFAVEFERRLELHDEGWIDGLEFGCRDCGANWT